MATASGDEDMRCSVCLEDCTEEGDHLPRILPCFHTACDKCIRQLIQHKSMRCPECRTVHPAKKGALSFKQNKYVLAHIRSKIQLTDTISCQKHGKQLSLYCKEINCQQAICQTCIIKHHVGHDVVDLEENREEFNKKVTERVFNLRKDLETKRGKLNSVSNDFNRDTEENYKKLKTRKEEFIEMFDKMETEIADCDKNVRMSVNHDIAILDKQLAALEKIEARTDAHRYSEIAKNLEDVDNINNQFHEFLSEPRRYTFRKFKASEVKFVDTMVVGSLQNKEIPVRLIDEKEVKRK